MLLGRMEKKGEMICRNIHVCTHTMQSEALFTACWACNKREREREREREIQKKAAAATTTTT